MQSRWASTPDRTVLTWHCACHPIVVVEMQLRGVIALDSPHCCFATADRGWMGYHGLLVAPRFPQWNALSPAPWVGFIVTNFCPCCQPRVGYIFTRGCTPSEDGPCRPARRLSNVPRTSAPPGPPPVGHSPKCVCNICCHILWILRGYSCSPGHAMTTAGFYPHLIHQDIFLVAQSDVNFVPHAGLGFPAAIAREPRRAVGGWVCGGGSLAKSSL